MLMSRLSFIYMATLIFYSISIPFSNIMMCLLVTCLVQTLGDPQYIILDFTTLRVPCSVERITISSFIPCFTLKLPAVYLFLRGNNYLLYFYYIFLLCNFLYHTFHSRLWYKLFSVFPDTCLVL